MGERAMTRDNHLLGKFDLTGIPPAPRGTPQIEVTFDVDANGILNVSAVEKGSGKQEKITITNDKGRLSKEEIDKMVNDAEKFKNEDEAQKERISAKNGLESYIFNMKSTLDQDQIKTKLSESDLTEAKKELDSTLDWLYRNQLGERRSTWRNRKSWSLALRRWWRRSTAMEESSSPQDVVNKPDRELKNLPLKKLTKIAVRI